MSLRRWGAHVVPGSVWGPGADFFFFVGDNCQLSLDLPPPLRRQSFFSEFTEFVRMVADLVTFRRLNIILMEHAAM